MYTDNGGTFSVPIVEEENGPMEVPHVAKHTVLKPTFRLCSQSFMLTYHSRLFTELTWPLFLAFLQDHELQHRVFVKGGIAN